MWGTHDRDSARKSHRFSLPQDDKASQMGADAVYISVLENFGLELL